jgi:hypothetical protein
MIESLKPLRELLDGWLAARADGSLLHVSVKVLRSHVDDLIRGRGSKKHALLALRHTEVEFENARRLAA